MRKRPERRPAEKTCGNASTEKFPCTRGEDLWLQQGERGRGKKVSKIKNQDIAVASGKTGGGHIKQKQTTNFF